MAPASAVAFSLGAAVPFAGGALPLAVVIALAVCTLIAVNIGSLAHHLPSAGGYFTYVSRGLGPQAGWMTGWVFSLTYLLIVPLQLLVLGPVAEGVARQYLHLSLGSIGWAVWAVFFAAVVFGLTYVGIKTSADAGVILGAIEVIVFLVLAAWLIVAAGHGNTAAAFNPASSLEPSLGGWQGTLHGMIFAFLAFAGFESCAPLAEEAKSPRQTVPRAILLATVLIGLFYVFCSYAAVVGWGFGQIATYSRDPNPWGTMAARVWGPFSVIAILAILNSALANANAGVNAASRVLYAMGRVGSLPRALAHLSTRFRTPDVAIVFVAVSGVLIALWPGFAYGPSTAFGLLGVMTTILILVVYMATCLAVPFFYLRERRHEFSALRHVVVPLIPFVLLMLPIAAQFWPAPAPPLDLAAPICAAWFVLGLIVVAVLSVRAPRTLARTNDVYLG